MSHLPLRKENNCLNCGATVTGRYCSECGQENTEPRESAWHLISHFFNDVTHFDGKFFSTLKLLLFRPGFLSKEYMKGRRASYLNPIRMYLFTSFIFFFIFFSVFHFQQKDFKDVHFTLNGKTFAQIDSLPSQQFTDFTKEINQGVAMSRKEFNAYKDSINREPALYIFGQKQHYKNKHEYDSLVAGGTIHSNWLKRQIIYKGIELNEKYKNQKGKFLSDFIESIIHHFPQILFISLPFVALLLQLLYIRQKQFYYVSHAIFTIHLYIFVFIAMLFEIGIQQSEKLHGFSWLYIISNLLTLVILFYVYKAMRNFYEQRRLRTIMKYILFLFSFFILIVFLFTIFAFVSIFQI
ncbi:MAG: DUF3667 domain-containing protein [Ginsengibacter sp.]